MGGVCSKAERPCCVGRCEEVMDAEKLKKHVKLCARNLKSVKVKCCGSCPFEEEITSLYPEMKVLYENKRKNS